MSKHIVHISDHLHDNVDSLTDKINVFLTDLKGHIVFEQQNLNSIDISNQPKGNYIAFLTNLDGGLIKKIRVIKE